MNEQKDKLLINLVEPGRIGRSPFNKLNFHCSSLFLMGELMKVSCWRAMRRQWEWSCFLFLCLWVDYGRATAPCSAQKRQAGREESSGMSLFSFFSNWRKQMNSIDEKKWRDEIEEQDSQATNQQSNSMNLRFWFIEWSWLVGLIDSFLFFAFLGWSARGAGYGRSSANGSAQEKTNAKRESKGKRRWKKPRKREQTTQFFSIPSIHESKDELIENWNWIDGVGLFGSLLFFHFFSAAKGAREKRERNERERAGSPGQRPSHFHSIKSTHSFHSQISWMKWKLIDSIPRLFKLLLDIEKVGYFNSTW